MNVEVNELMKYLNLVKSIRIDHLAYTSILDALEGALLSVGKTATPECVHIAGGYRTGKSCVIDDFMSRYPPERLAEGVRRSIVQATIPYNGTVKALVEALLRAFGDPHWARGSESNQTARLLDFLEKTRCKMIILDEFQHLCDKGQQKRLDHTTDWLKTLIEKKPWALVVAGLPESCAIINRNGQLQGRFDHSLVMPLFDWTVASDRTQFRSIVRSFVAEMHPFELPDLGGEELAFRTYLATSGRVGLFAKLMDRAVRHAIQGRTTKIQLTDLADAYTRAIWFASTFPLKGGPFLCDLPQERNDLLVRALGMASDASAYREGNGQIHLHGVEPKASVGAKTPRQTSTRSKVAKDKEDLRRTF
ncbi:TniB family NTP-binding protein [Thermomonas brevis]|uniref:TniB family NTP-binding protein n=1 Tax=Thermomonas brevis TaxID=215691 RepID=A0A7G9QQ45_9GAMM|nr:TniB family NTP-binding protein [Thermomonas brevis]QNN45470.1 TniB family NTP-binding protein [Thermomonas brevis]